MQPLDSETFFTGTQISYFIVCPAKLWYFSHFLRQERNSDLVSMGKVLHETSFKRQKKEILIDNKISVDFIEKGDKIIIHDVKKSKKLEKAHIYQLLYYLYYLKQKGIKAEGEIDYPAIRKIEKVKLTGENENEIITILNQIKEIISRDKPPTTEKKRYCRRCSYFEFCWCY